MDTHLSDGPADDDRGVLGVGQHTASGVVEAEIGSPVDDDALYWYSEATVQSSQAIRLEDLGQAVAQTAKFTLTASLAYVGGQPVNNDTNNNPVLTVYIQKCYQNRIIASSSMHMCIA